MVSLLKQKISLQRFRQLALKPKQICCILEKENELISDINTYDPRPFDIKGIPAPAERAFIANTDNNVYKETPYSMYGNWLFHRH